MSFPSLCPKCGNKMTKIPYRKINNSIIVELYCYKCDKVITYYPEFRQVRFKHSNIF